MKKFFLVGSLLVAATFYTNTANAQLGNLLNQVVSAASGSISDSSDSNTSNLIGNLISSVTGSITTTQSNLIGSWAYTEPCVQFTSENALSQAGGTVVATKVENTLNSIYSKCGFDAGDLQFTFDNDGTCTYGTSKRSLSGTYTFNNENKTITIITSLKKEVTANVTISGSSMSLTFNANKLLTLFQSLSTKVSSLSTVSAIASQYSGMKVGFEFNKK